MFPIDDVIMRSFVRQDILTGIGAILFLTFENVHTHVY